MRRLFVLLWLLLGVQAVQAAPAPPVTPLLVPPAGRQVVLPVTGLSVRLPARKDLRCEIRGAWGMAGSEFWGRDSVDEWGPDGRPVAGTWVSVGWFLAGGSTEVARETARDLGLTRVWEGRTALWGLDFSVVGGLHDFQRDPGVRPALVLVAEGGEGAPSLVLVHFLSSARTDMPRDRMLAQAGGSPTLAAVVEAWSDGLWGDAQPTRDPAVRQPEDFRASRPLRLTVSGLQVHLPEDGFVWTEEPEPGEATDFLHRLAPALPEVTVEVMIRHALTAREAFGPGVEPSAWSTPPRNVPAPWTAGPRLTTVEGVRETTVALARSGRVLVVGFLANPPVTDLEDYQPLLRALEAAFARPSP